MLSIQAPKPIYYTMPKQPSNRLLSHMQFRRARAQGLSINLCYIQKLHQDGQDQEDDDLGSLGHLDAHRFEQGHTSRDDHDTPHQWITQM